MVLHGGGGGDGAKNKATKTTVKHAKPSSAAVIAGLKEAQQERKAAAGETPRQQQQQQRSALDALDSDSDEESDALCAACASKKPNTVRRALSAPDVSPNVVGSQGMTPLFIASQGNSVEIVSMLLAARADPAQAPRCARTRHRPSAALRTGASYGRRAWRGRV